MQRAAQSILFVVLLFSTPLCLAQNNAPNSEQGTASISGRVTIDGKPARDIIVQTILLDKVSQFSQWQKYGIVASPHTITNEDGNFRLINLESGRYIISPSTPSMIGIRESDDAAQPAIIALKAGTTVEGIHITLTRGGVITGRVTYEDDSPVIDAQVICSRDEVSQPTMPSRSFSFNFFEQTIFRTDDRGIYRIYGLLEGSYKIKVLLNNNQIIKSRQHPQAFYYSNTMAQAKATAVEVKNGSEARDIDIKLSAPSKLYTVSGRVFDVNTNKPLADISLYFIATGLEVGYTTDVVITNKKGEFLVENLPSSSYHIRIVRSPEQQGEYYSEITSFEVRNANVDGIEVKLHKGLTVSGTILFEGAANTDKAAILQQLQLRAVSSQKTESGSRTESASYAEISPDGNFSIKGLSPGSVIIDLLAKSGIALLSIERDGVQVRPFELHNGEAVNDIRITLGETDCTIRGQVMIADGTLPDNAMLQISARRINSDPPDPYDFKFSKSIIVNPDNRFTIPELVAGKYEVTLIAEVRTKERINRWIAKQRVSVDSRQTAETTITLNLIADKEKY